MAYKGSGDARGELQERFNKKVKGGMVKGRRWAWPIVQEEGVAYCTAAGVAYCTAAQRSAAGDQLPQTGVSWCAVERRRARPRA